MFPDIESKERKNKNKKKKGNYVRNKKMKILHRINEEKCYSHNFFFHRVSRAVHMSPLKLFNLHDEKEKQIQT